MFLLTYSFHALGSSTIYHHMAFVKNPLDWLVQKRQKDPSVCIIWMRELTPQQQRLLDGMDLKEVGIER